MKNSVAVYHSLPEEARKIREEVFVREQGFQEEFDEIDGYAVHLVLFCDGTPAAVCRFYTQKEEGGYVFGRLAVRKAYRGRSLGALLLAEAEREIKKREAEPCAFMPRGRHSPFMKNRAMRRTGRRILMRAVPMCGWKNGWRPEKDQDGRSLRTRMEDAGSPAVRPECFRNLAGERPVRSRKVLMK